MGTSVFRRRWIAIIDTIWVGRRTICSVSSSWSGGLGLQSSSLNRAAQQRLLRASNRKKQPALTRNNATKQQPTDPENKLNQITREVIHHSSPSLSHLSILLASRSPLCPADLFLMSQVSIFSSSYMYRLIDDLYFSLNFVFKQREWKRWGSPVCVSITVEGEAVRIDFRSIHIFKLDWITTEERMCKVLLHCIRKAW